MDLAPHSHEKTKTNGRWYKTLKLPPNVTFAPRKPKMPNLNVEKLLNRMWKPTLAPGLGSLLALGFVRLGSGFGSKPNLFCVKLLFNHSSSRTQLLFS